MSKTPPSNGAAPGASKPSKYRNPPAEHRFKPGVSGNRRGRPKKKPTLSFDSSKGGLLDRNFEVLLDVVSRPIFIREGDKTEKVSGLEALYRSMLRNAAQGDAATGRILLQLIEKAESRRAEFQQQILAAAMQHVETWNDVFWEREQKGLPAPEVYPHPAHVEVVLTTGNVIFHGPVTKADAMAVKGAEEVAIGQMGRLIEVDLALEKDPANAELRAERKRLEPVSEMMRQMRERHVRLGMWKLARAAHAKSLNPQLRQRRPKRSANKNENE